MFGTNPIRKLDQAPEDGKLAVQEVFYTIQGEGPYSGHPAVFIRLAGCHLACTFCDTEFESGINNRMAVRDVATRAMQMVVDSAGAPPIVVLTGGEPLRQDVVPLIDLLLACKFRHVQIETAGNLWVEKLAERIADGGVSLVCSPKTNHVHGMVAQYCHHWKYVVKADAIDKHGLPGAQTQVNGGGVPWRKQHWGPLDKVWLSPMDEHEPFKNAANVKAAVDACMIHGHALSLQLHKILGMP